MKINIGVDLDEIIENILKDEQFVIFMLEEIARKNNDDFTTFMLEQLTKKNSNSMDIEEDKINEPDISITIAAPKKKRGRPKLIKNKL